MTGTRTSVRISVLSMSVGNFVAIQQTNVVRLLGYSSIAQAGFMLAPFGAVAAANAVARASSTVRNIRQVEVVRHTAKVDEGRITEYEVELKIFFEYEGT